MLLNNKYGNFFRDFFILIWGPTGTGKSHCIEDIIYHLQQFWFIYCGQNNLEYQKLEVYNKKSNKWWDSYKGEKIVVIEELEPQWVCHSGNLLKQLCDQYPFPVEVKGATINKIRPFWVIMTSNYSLKKLCTKENGELVTENYEPLHRRLFTVELTKLGNFFEWPREDRLKKYFSTHSIVKADRENQKKERRMKLLSIIDERNHNNSLETNKSFAYYEDFQQKDEDYFLETISTTSESVISINYCTMHYDFNNSKYWEDYTLYKSIIKGLKQLIHIQNNRIAELELINTKHRLTVSNLNEAYKFISSLKLGKNEIFEDQKQKDYSLTDIITQMANVGQLINENEHEICHFKFISVT
ncbi:hypothetical protein BCR32DRAFT_249072 [Anaeromyces robustus]|uniref:SF3 helicase domain-containing protein n=1 Tax=Anaeromyces robustus TaxID=1754192 RepID=A0A1Y1WRE0_9FUNG|nr:hypothetical protein BCR32DRAFT_249072 [Anaeromyces robustus]|eukprot:ORX76042.1 hypothetical protein BCR32DRAFT_249072 [Anaeromyces robustus]